MTAPGAAGSVWGANVWGTNVWGVNVWGGDAASTTTYADIGQRVQDILATATGVVDLVSDRVYFNDIPQHTKLPCVTIDRISEVFERAFIETTGNRRTRFQVNYWSEGRYDGVDGRRAVDTALSRYRTATGTPIIDGTEIVGKWDVIDDEREEAPVYQTITDYWVHSKPTDVVVYYPLVSGSAMRGLSTTDTGYRFAATGSTITGIEASSSGYVFVSRGATTTVSYIGEA